MFAQGRDLAQRELACQRDARKAQLRERRYAVLGMDAHLGGRVQLRLRKRSGKRNGEAQVLHDEGVRPGVDAAARRLERARHLLGKDDGVHGDVHARAAQVRVVAGLGEGFVVEVFGGSAGVQLAHAEVGGIGAGRHDGVQHGGVSRRR